MYLSAKNVIKKLAVIQSIVFLGAFFLANYHLATASHGYCTDHGEVIHLSSLSSEISSDPTQDQIKRSINVYGPHDCCALKFLVQTKLNHFASGTLVFFENIIFNFDIPRTSFIRPIPILSFSPKSSPPIA